MADDPMGKLLTTVLERELSKPPRADADWNAELDRIFNEPPDPELLTLAGKAVEAQERYKRWFDSLTPEEQEKARQAEIDREVDFIMHGPGGD